MENAPGSWLAWVSLLSSGTAAFISLALLAVIVAYYAALATVNGFSTPDKAFFFFTFTGLALAFALAAGMVGTLTGHLVNLRAEMPDPRARIGARIGLWVVLSLFFVYITLFGVQSATLLVSLALLSA